MPRPLACPPADTWESLLDATLPPEQQEQLEGHLESCSACQERLDRGEGCGGDLLTRIRELRDLATEAADPTLARIVERLHEEKSLGRLAQQEPVDLYFLRPAEPPLLGYLDEYEVREVIGQGGMGVVLKAFEPALCRLVAIKVLSPALAGSATARRRFTREAQAAAAVCHDHVVPIYAVREVQGLPYLVMQYVSGESLQDRLDRSGPLEVVDVVCIGLQTALGLAAAHAQGLIHRDVKPANLLLEPPSPPTPLPQGERGECRVKIADFGLARMADDVELTRQGVVVGTPEYMAPEQARGEAVDHRADLFSLGSVLYACCAGVSPFRGATAVAVIHKVSEQEPTPIRSLNPDVPAWLETLIARLLAKDPADRFQSASEVAGLLEGYLAQLRQPLTVPAPELPAAPSGIVPRRPARGRNLLVCLLLAVLGLVTALGMLAELPPGQPAATDFYQDFRRRQEPQPPLKLIGTEADAVTRSEEEGFRITLAASRKTKQPVGVVPEFPLVGDFEITATYELLAAAQPTRGIGMAVALNVASNNPYKFAKLGRFVRVKEGNVYLAETFLKNSPADSRVSSEATEAKRGQLRLIRQGSTLSFLVADGAGADFRQILRAPFGTDDVTIVRFIVNNNDSPAAVDARLVDLRIRSSSGSGGPTAAAGSRPDLRLRGWLLGALLLGMVLIVSVLGGWLYRQPRRSPELGTETQEAHPAAAASISFACSTCGKSLKARTELAGKKIKCPGCGKTTIAESREDPVSPPPDPLRSADWNKWVLRSVIAFVLLVVVGAILVRLSRPSQGLSRANLSGDSRQPLLGAETVPGVEESGFYGTHFNHLGQPYRWTNGHARLVIPIDPARAPQKVRLQLWPWRPARAGRGRLRILINQRELFNEPVSSERWDRTFALDSVDLGKEMVLEIVGDTFVPSKYDGGSGTFPVGVHVFGVQLLAAGDNANQ